MVRIALFHCTTQSCISTLCQALYLSYRTIKLWDGVESQRALLDQMGWGMSVSAKECENELPLLYSVDKNKEKIKLQIHQELSTAIVLLNLKILQI